MKWLLLFVPLFMLSVQEKPREELLVNYWVIQEVQLNGKVDHENYPINDDWLEFRRDGTFSMKDNTRNTLRSGTWKIIGSSNLSLYFPQGDEKVTFDILELTNEKLVYQLPISKGVLRISLKAENKP